MAQRDATLQIGADASQANAEFEKLAQQAMTSSQQIQSSFREASYNMASSMKESTAVMNSSLGQITAVAQKVQGAMFAIGAVLAGGAAFKQAISETAAYYAEAQKLGRALGTTATEAGTLMQVLDNIHVSTDEFSSAAKGLEKQINKNEAGLNKMGLVTRDTSGHLRPLNDLMIDAIKIVNDHREGTDRNVTATRFFGKAIEDGSNLLKYNKEAAEEARKSNDELNLTIGERGAANAKAYKDAMKDVGDIFQGVLKTVADALMPALTELAKWMRDKAPAAISALKGSLNFIIASFKFWSLAISEVGEFYRFLEKVATSAISGIAKAWSALINGEGVAGVENAIKKTAINIQDAFTAMTNNMHNNLLRTKMELKELYSDDKPVKEKSKTGGSAGEGGKNTSRVSEWRDELIQSLETEKNYFKDSLAAEIEFWQQKRNVRNLSKNERIAIDHELYTLHKRQAQQELQEEISDLKLQSDAARAGGVDRIRIAGEIAAKIGEKYGQESKEYKAALLEMQKAAQAHQQQMIRLDELRIERQKQHAINEVEMQRETLRTKRELGNITDAQELQAVRDLEEQKYQIEYQAELDRAKLLENDVVAQQQAYDKLAQMAEKHAADMLKINNDIAIKQKSEWDKMLQPLQSAFDTTVKGIVQGTTTLQKALSNIFKSILVEFTNMGLKMVAQWAWNEARKTLATQAGVTARSAAEAAGSGQSLMLQAGLAIKKILNAAWETFAGIFALLSGEMGPAAAGPAAAGMATVAGAAGSIAFAARGYDIPAGINPMVQAHSKEMILPAEQADVIRGLAGGGASGGMSNHFHFNGPADAKSFENWLLQNPNTLAPAMRRLNRNFSPSHAGQSPLGRKY